jgi:hypothetical protein
MRRSRPSSPAGCGAPTIERFQNTGDRANHFGRGTYRGVMRLLISRMFICTGKCTYGAAGTSMPKRHVGLAHPRR